MNYNHNSTNTKASMTHPDIHFELRGDHQEVAVIRLTRAAKRNALNDGLILALRDLFEKMPSTVRAAVIDGDGPHFCAGLDLSELKERDAGQGLHHSRMWHAALERVQYGPVPVIAALHGAVVGGGLELASACHIRVADESTFYALPEGSRGIFVGGGGAVRIPKLIGAARMTDMMLTGRVYNAQDGEKVGFAQYLVPEGQAFAKALERAHAADPDGRPGVGLLRLEAGHSLAGGEANPVDCHTCFLLVRIEEFFCMHFFQCGIDTHLFRGEGRASEECAEQNKNTEQTDSFHTFISLCCNRGSLSGTVIKPF